MKDAFLGASFATHTSVSWVVKIMACFRLREIARRHTGRMERCNIVTKLWGKTNGKSFFASSNLHTASLVGSRFQLEEGLWQFSAVTCVGWGRLSEIGLLQNWGTLALLYGEERNVKLIPFDTSVDIFGGKLVFDRGELLEQYCSCRFVSWISCNPGLFGLDFVITWIQFLGTNTLLCIVHVTKSLLEQHIIYVLWLFHYISVSFIFTGYLKSAQLVFSNFTVLGVRRRRHFTKLQLPLHRN